MVLSDLINLILNLEKKMLSKSAAITLMKTIESEEFKAFSNNIDCRTCETETLCVAVIHAISAIAGNISQQDFETKMNQCKGVLYLNTGLSIKSLSNDPHQVISNFLKTVSLKEIGYRVQGDEHQHNLHSYPISRARTMLIMNEFMTNLHQLNEIDPVNVIESSARFFFNRVENGGQSNNSPFNLLPKELRTNISFFATKACIEDEFPNIKENMDQTILNFLSR